MLQKLVKIYANHGIPLECDIYTSEDTVVDAPVFLFFHAGALTGWGRDCVPPWLVQTCYTQKWPLISVSYRLMPQTGTDGLMQDATAAYEFARNWNTSGDTNRSVIVGGASAGFFLATFLGRTASPPPLALFSISGISSFTHPFYSSSTLITSEPSPHASSLQAAMSGPCIVGRSIPGGHEGAASFRMEALAEDGSRDPAFRLIAPEDTRTEEQKRLWEQRSILYRYYIYENLWPGMTAAMDAGREWQEWSAERKAKWPLTVIFHGNSDTGVPLGVSEEMRRVVGEDKVSLFIAEGEDHLYERAMFIEDDEPGMVAVRDAVGRLVEIVAEKR